MKKVTTNLLLILKFSFTKYLNQKIHKNSFNYFKSPDSNAFEN